MRKLCAVLIVVAFMLVHIGVYRSHHTGSASLMADARTVVLQGSMHVDGDESEPSFFQHR